VNFKEFVVAKGIWRVVQVLILCLLKLIHVSGNSF